MCGIAGFVGDFGPQVASAMESALAHRGPDDADVWVDPSGSAALAHRRLAIVDLSRLGHQPMPDSSGRFWLSYNGEIYNAAELRRSLQQRGCQLRSHSDTEILVELLARDGVDALPRLNGIFAFALWDRVERQMLLVRDQLGIKPLYVTQTRDGVAFASEIKALLCVPGLDRTVDHAAAAAYLTYLYSPGERTMLKAVKKLPPGSWLRIDAQGRPTTGTYYQLPNPDPRQIKDRDAIEMTRSALAKAVERQMMADVEVGAFLSGGLDSTSIVHFARHHSDRPLRCFTARYDASSDEFGELVADLPYARRAAEHLGVELHEVSIDDRIADEFPELIATLDEPQADPAALLNMKIAEGARQHGIKVLLSGTGGDDIFTGYRRHLAARSDRLVGLLPEWVRDAAARGGRARLGARNATIRRLAKLAAGVGGSATDRVLSRFEWLNAETAAAIVSGQVEAGAIRAPMAAALAELGAASSLDRTLRLDQLFFLVDHNLNYADKTGMAHGVEIRVPFLDIELVALASQLPRAAKIRGTTTKWALRKAMEPFLPREIIYRPKTGFGVPLRSWLRGRLRPMMEELLSASAVEGRGILDFAQLDRLRRDTLAGRVDGSYSLLAAMAIELWCRRFLDGPAAEAQLSGPVRAKRGIATSKAIPSSSTMR